MMANWTLSPKKEFPDPQIYLLTTGMNDAVVIDALVAFYKVLVGRIWSACTTIKWPHTSKLTLWWVHAATGWSRVDVADSPGLDFTKTN
jgi:hypothetical protein